MRSIIRVSAAAAVFLGSATIAPPVALAAPPVISGPYIFSVSSNCQATLSVVRNSLNQVTGVSVVSGGALNSSAGTATFTPATGQVVLSATKVDGNLLLVKGVNTTVLKQTAHVETAPYSNTATTVTFEGIVYSAVYGKISNGIVQDFNLVGREEANRCVFGGTFTHK